MSDVFLASRLQTAMGDAYRLERELPGGGMSRLFVALESSLNRRVVIKVLPPELTSEVSAARFKQEIELAAHLQHPHILPILAAGSKDDLLYYVMPFITGESLRQHIERSGPMPVAEAVRILREVADALGYAHRKGIVHRDIKPENILLEDGHAVLADFGVARAIDEARSGAPLPRVTGTGMSVGTPHYMAPEQASGERHIDARADLYALAVVGYEMLAGKLPFSAPSAQAMIAAHMTAPPSPLTKSRPDVPSAVSTAIAKALAKSPEERYRTAEDFRDALDPGAAAAAVGGGRRRRMIAAVAAAAVLAVGALIATWRSRPKLDDNAFAIAPFDVLDPELKLWHEGMVDVLSRNLDGAGDLRSVAPTIVLRRWTGHADRASAAELGLATGARYAVFGTLLKAGDSVVAKVSVLDVRTGRDVGEEIERRDIPARIDRLADSLTFSLVRALSRTPQLGAQKLSALGTNSLPALKAYLQGEQYFRRSDWDSAIIAYQRATDLDSTFAIASRELGEAYGWVGGAGDTLSNFYLARAGRHNRGLSARDSLLVAAEALWARATRRGGDPRTLQDRQDVLRMLEQATRRYPDDPMVWYLFGDARYHLASGRVVGVPMDKLLAPFDHAIALDSSFTPSYVHAVDLAFSLGGIKAGRRYIAAYLSQHPTDVDAGGIALAQRLTDPSQANSEETNRLLATATNDMLLSAMHAVRLAPDSAEVAVRVMRLLSPSRATSYAAFGDAAYQRRTLAGILLERGHWREANATAPQGAQGIVLMLGGFPPESAMATFSAQLSTKRGCFPCFYNYWAARGDTASLTRATHVADSALGSDTSLFARSTHAYWTQYGQAFLLLARHDSAAALHAFVALPDSLCYKCGPFDLTQAQLLEGAKRDRDALTLLSTTGGDASLFAIMLTLERGRVAERLGEKEIAVDSYVRVAGLWQNGDPFLQPYVADARAALKRLGGERAQGIPVTGVTLPR